MLAACVNDDDVFRVQTPLTILNQFPPFSRSNNKWRPIELPAVTRTLTLTRTLTRARTLTLP